MQNKSQTVVPTEEMNDICRGLTENLTKGKGKYTTEEDEGDPLEEQAQQQEQLEAEINTVLSETFPGQTNLMEQWKIIEKVLDSKHLEFTQDNLKEFADHYGEEFINLLSRRSLDPDERKLFNLTLKIRLLNIIQSIIFEKTLREMTNKNTNYFDKLNEKLYLESETAVNHLLYDIQAALEDHASEVKTIIKKEGLDIQQRKNEVVEAVKSAEQLRLDIEESREKTLNGVAKLLKHGLGKHLHEGIEKIIESESKRRKLLNQKHFKHLFIVSGISLFVFGICLYNLIK